MGIKTFLKPVTDKITESQGPPTPLIPPNLQGEKIKLELLQNAEKFAERIGQGLTNLVNEVEAIAKEDPDFVTEDELKRIKDISKPESLSEDDLKNRSIMDILGLDENLIGKFYSASDHLFAAERFKEASDALFFIANIEPTESIFWLALGNAEFLQENWTEALKAFSLAYYTNPSDPRAVIYAAQCHHELGDNKQAAMIIDSIIQYYPEESLVEFGDLKGLREALCPAE
jgi:tetratricopeptide (TPR) repeat protein